MAKRQIVGFVTLGLFAAPALGLPLHTPGVTVSASAQFSGVTDGDSDPQSATVSVAGTSFPGTGFASAVYNGPVRVAADSAPDGTGAIIGDSISTRASMATVNRFTSSTLAPGTIVDAFVNLNLTGRIVNLGNRSAGLGSIELAAGLERETAAGSALKSALLIFQGGSITTNTGFGTQLVSTDIITGNPFVDVVYLESIPIQVAVDELFSVELVVQAITGVTHRADFSNTASFTITPVTAGITLEVLPSVPEPAIVSLLLAAALVGAGLRKTGRRVPKPFSAGLTRHTHRSGPRAWAWGALIPGLWLCTGGSALPAGAASITFDDFSVAQGDRPSTAGDLIRARLDFDLATGAYTATWTAEASGPFTGDIQFFLNLVNETIDPVSIASITSIVETFPATSGATSLSASGVELGLTRWSIGDQILSEGSGLNFGFSSGVLDLNLPHPNNRDILFQTSATVVPEARLNALLALGLGLASGAVTLRRRSFPRA